DIRQAITICSGMGYYSLSAMVCSQKFGEVVGVIALLSNLLRELLTMMFAPLLVKAFGNLAPIGTGGATAMDTTLPFIKKSAGSEYAIIGFISGVVLTVLVPIVGVLL
ncbi:MAG TPA: LysO family transporter, partial [Candidatus Cloacimonadota bacterium]|nr:LysO family transporter [Candidatus Cloacimonadota bacterium]